MPPSAAQTIYELVQIRKNRESDSSNCFSSLGRSSAPQNMKSLSEVFSSLVISFTLSSHLNPAFYYFISYTICGSKANYECIFVHLFINLFTAAAARLTGLLTGLINSHREQGIL